MGFILDVDLETSEGPSHEVYVRVESLTFNKVTSMVQFQITYWQNQDYALRFNRTTLEEQPRNAVGLVQERVLYFENETSDGVEILLPHHMKVPLVSEEQIEVPMYEVVSVEKEVPFVSFDENGDEIIKTRIVTREEKVKTGTKVEVKQVINNSLLGNLIGFIYSKIKERLSEVIPADKILTVK